MSSSSSLSSSVSSGSSSSSSIGSNTVKKTDAPSASMRPMPICVTPPPALSPGELARLLGMMSFTLEALFALSNRRIPTSFSWAFTFLSARFHPCREATQLLDASALRQSRDEMVARQRLALQMLCDHAVTIISIVSSNPSQLIPIIKFAPERLRSNWLTYASTSIDKDLHTLRRNVHADDWVFNETSIKASRLTKDVISSFHPLHRALLDREPMEHVFVLDSPTHSAMELIRLEALVRFLFLRVEFFALSVRPTGIESATSGCGSYIIARADSDASPVYVCCSRAWMMVLAFYLTWRAREVDKLLELCARTDVPASLLDTFARCMLRVFNFTHTGLITNRETAIETLLDFKEPILTRIITDWRASRRTSTLEIDRLFLPSVDLFSPKTLLHLMCAMRECIPHECELGMTFPIAMPNNAPLCGILTQCLSVMSSLSRAASSQDPHHSPQTSPAVGIRPTSGCNASCSSSASSGSSSSVSSRGKDSADDSAPCRPQKRARVEPGSG